MPAANTYCKRHHEKTNKPIKLQKNALFFIPIIPLKSRVCGGHCLDNTCVMHKIREDGIKHLRAFMWPFFSRERETERESTGCSSTVSSREH